MCETNLCKIKKTELRAKGLEISEEQKVYGKLNKKNMCEEKKTKKPTRSDNVRQ